MSTHTPAPWLVVEGKPFVYALNANGFNRWSLNIQADWRACPEAELMANAHLIAAAPDLLAALREATEIIESEGPGLYATGRAAIDKATGGTP